MENFPSQWGSALCLIPPQRTQGPLNTAGPPNLSWGGLCDLGAAPAGLGREGGRKRDGLWDQDQGRERRVGLWDQD